MEHSRDQENMEHWKTCPVSEWNSHVVYSWIYHLVLECNLDNELLRFENFNDVTGVQLCHMTPQEFVRRDANYGRIIYDELTKLKRRTSAQSLQPSWQHKHPETWSNADVLDWIFYLADCCPEINVQKLYAEQFQELDGRTICQMNCGDFQRRDEIHGHIIFNCLKEILSKCQFMPPAEIIDNGNVDISNRRRHCDTDYHVVPNMSQCVDLSDKARDYITLTDVVCNNYGRPCDGYSPTYDSQSARFKPLPLVLENYNSPEDVEHLDMLDGSSTFSSRQPKRFKSHKSPKESKHESHNITTLNSSPDSDEYSDDENGNMLNRKNPGAPKCRTTHLWQFMRDLLENPEFNPDCIRWENREEGIFRIVSGRSKIIAEQWGKKKNNPTMTFDKMSRSLRWCRTNDFLSAVPKTGRYPKKLCFRFGPKADHWREMKH